MDLTTPEDPTFRPVGAGKVKRRIFSVRHLGLILAVLAIGGGGGTAAYFLSDMDMRDIIGFLDIADPGGPKLTMLMPGVQTDATTAKPAGTEGTDLLTPPGGPVHRPEPVAIAPPQPPPLPISIPEPPKLETKDVPVAPAKDEHPASPPAAAAEKPFDSKLFAGIMVPPPMAPAQSVPPPAPRAADQIPNLSELPERKSDAPLSAAPEKALLGNSAHGPIPVIAPDGRQPWKVYARPFDGPKDQPRIAVVVTDLGLDMATTEAAIARLPADVTLAFSPYSLELTTWIKKARDTGHEALIILPIAIDAPGASDPGPLGLAQGLSEKDNIARLETILSRAPGVIGVLVPKETFLSEGTGAPILAVLLQRGLLYVGAPVRGLRNPPVATITDSIDRSPWRAAIDAKLTQALSNKTPQGQVLLATPKPITLRTLVPWLDALPTQGMITVPVSAVAVAPGG